MVDDEVGRRGDEDFGSIQIVDRSLVDEFGGWQEGGARVETKGAMEINFQGPGAREWGVGMADGQFDLVAGLSGIAEGLEDGDGCGKLFRGD